MTIKLNNKQKSVLDRDQFKSTILAAREQLWEASMMNTSVEEWQNIMHALHTVKEIITEIDNVSAEILANTVNDEKESKE